MSKWSYRDSHLCQTEPSQTKLCNLSSLWEQQRTSLFDWLYLLDRRELLDTPSLPEQSYRQATKPAANVVYRGSADPVKKGITFIYDSRFYISSFPIDVEMRWRDLTPTRHN